MVILNLDSELSEKSANFHKIVCCKTLLISKRISLEKNRESKTITSECFISGGIEFVK